MNMKLNQLNSSLNFESVLPLITENLEICENKAVPPFLVDCFCKFTIGFSLQAFMNTDHLISLS